MKQKTMRGQEKALLYLCEQTSKEKPITKHREIREYLGVSRQRANDIKLLLVKAGRIQELDLGLRCRFWKITPQGKEYARYRKDQFQKKGNNLRNQE